MLARKIASPLKPSSGREYTAFLERVKLFEALRDQPEAFDVIAESMTLRDFAVGEMIVRENEPGLEMFLLVEGRASVFKTTAEGELYRVAILESSHYSFFGEGGLLESDSRSATIQAETPCRCLVLSRESFQAFGARYPQWALPIVFRIANAVMSRLRKSNEDLILIYNALVSEIRGN